MRRRFTFDFVFSFAGEDRPTVEVVKTTLAQNGIRVFYDSDYQHELLGKDLAEYFANLYQNEAQYCVVFLSKAYLRKPWCRWERRSALARAFKSRKEYIIPYFLERVTNPSLPDTIGRADARDTPPLEFAQLLLKKLYSATAIYQIAPGILLCRPQDSPPVFLYHRDYIASKGPDWEDMAVEFSVYASAIVRNTTDKPVDVEGKVSRADGWRTVIAMRRGAEVPGGWGTITVGPQGVRSICFQLGALTWREDQKDGVPIVIPQWKGPTTFTKRLPENIAYETAEKILSSECFKLFNNLSYTLHFSYLKSSASATVINGDLWFGDVVSDLQQDT